MIRSSPRPSFRAVAIALAAAFALSLVIIATMSRQPGRALFYFFAGPLVSRYHAGNLLDGATLLMLSGLGICIAFRGGTFNLGGEGQSYIGALVASQLALAPVIAASPTLPAVMIVLLAAALAGGAVAAIAGALRAALGIDELITSFLLSSAIIPIVDFAISGPLRDPEGYLLATRLISESVRLGHPFPPSTLNAGFLIAIALAVGVDWSMRRTLPGYELRMTGSSAGFAAYVGIGTGRYRLASMAGSGALLGLAGGLYVIGSKYLCAQGGTAGIGWNGIAVALIAENQPLAVIPAALVFSYLTTATETAMLNTGFSFELSALVQAAVFLLITVKRFGRQK